MLTIKTPERVFIVNFERVSIANFEHVIVDWEGFYLNYSLVPCKYYACSLKELNKRHFAKVKFIILLDTKKRNPRRARKKLRISSQ